MDLQLKGKKAIVTGASRGIGRAIAETLAAEGCDVAICARGQAGVDEVVSALSAKGHTAFGAAVDIADGPALKAWISASAERLGGLDILVSNASALTRGAGEDDWKAMYEVDLMGAVRALEAARPFLEQAGAANGDAAFIITSSVSAAETSAPGAYGSIKAALVHFAKGVAREGAPRHLRCNVVSPGTVLFDGGVWGVTRDRAPDFFKMMIERNPTGRMGTPEEIAAATVFLASPRSAFTTGINMVVDGSITQRANF
ncbi:MAG TPA: SDR family oxidoreductase [Caulobacteraceae bacterium]|jgi:3-oxoacyl-[acyl-carrier protein] reductase|nr:SDR family oxidoreductase [Caulobacteraceae bacterium]